MMALAVAAACPLAIARTLHPDSTGLGTHRQLGLPPCSSLALFGIRCPACGMTTSWAHLVRGEFSAGLKANAGGFALGTVCLVTILVTFWHAAIAKLPGRKWALGLAWGLGISLAFAMLDWGWRFFSGNG